MRSDLECWDDWLRGCHEYQNDRLAHAGGIISGAIESFGYYKLIRPRKIRDIELPQILSKELADKLHATEQTGWSRELIQRVLEHFSAACISTLAKHAEWAGPEWIAFVQHSRWYTLHPDHEQWLGSRIVERAQENEWRSVDYAAICADLMVCSQIFFDRWEIADGMYATLARLATGNKQPRTWTITQFAGKQPLQRRSKNESPGVSGIWLAVSARIAKLTQQKN